MVNEYMSAEAAEASSPYASAAPEGSSTWWTEEIAGREAAAQANTESTPSDSGGGSTAFYEDPRTGERYASKEQFLSQNPSGVSVPQWSTPGVPVVTPTGETFYSRFSQYWMDPNYKGPDPSLAEKAAYSTADYARDFAGTLMNQYTETVSPAAKVIQKTYPTVRTTPVTQQVAEQSVDTSALFDSATDIFNKGITWLSNNLLIVIIVIAGIFVLPRLADAALPARRR